MPPVADARFPIVVAHPGNCVTNPVLPLLALRLLSENSMCSPISSTWF